MQFSYLPNNRNNFEWSTFKLNYDEHSIDYWPLAHSSPDAFEFRETRKATKRDLEWWLVCNWRTRFMWTCYIICLCTIVETRCWFHIILVFLLVLFQTIDANLIAKPVNCNQRVRLVISTSPIYFAVVAHVRKWNLIAVDRGKCSTHYAKLKGNKWRVFNLTEAVG